MSLFRLLEMQGLYLDKEQQCLSKLACRLYVYRYDSTAPLIEN